jgi:hypothetical protein
MTRAALPLLPPPEPPLASAGAAASVVAVGGVVDEGPVVDRGVVFVDGRFARGAGVVRAGSAGGGVTAGVDGDAAGGCLLTVPVGEACCSASERGMAYSFSEGPFCTVTPDSWPVAAAGSTAPTRRNAVVTRRRAITVSR